MQIARPLLEQLKANLRDAKKEAILAPGKRGLIYSALLNLIQETGNQFSQAGFLQNDRIALVLPNGAEAATAFLAISSVCTCAPLNPAYRQDDFEFYLADLKARAVVTEFDDDHPCRKAAEKLGIRVIELIPEGQTAGRFRVNLDSRPKSEIHEIAALTLDDIALVLHTSGTTAQPKIVALTCRNIYHSAQNIIDTYYLSPADRCLNMMPLFHIHGLAAAVLASLVSGGSVICTPGFESGSVESWLTDLQPTWYSAVPTIHLAMLDEWKKVKSKRHHHLRFIRSCSSPLPAKLGEELEREFKVPVLEAYGMTEATHQIASNPLPPAAHKFGSVGRATGTTSVGILNESGEQIPEGNSGEICIRGENVITGYENNPEANKVNFINGWLKTGDRGFFDHEGYIHIQGRNKDLINRGGEKISPREIEEVLLLHPSVKEAVVFPVSHSSLGEDVAAAVVLNAGKQAGMMELRQFAAEKLVDFKVPRLVIVTSKIPKGPTGKVIRMGLAEKLKDEIQEARISLTKDATLPRNETERELALIWKEVLGIDSIGIREDFLALGGDSLKAARILSQVERKIGVRLILNELFSTPTIEEMAAYIHSTRKH